MLPSIFLLEEDVHGVVEVWFVRIQFDLTRVRALLSQIDRTGLSFRLNLAGTLGIVRVELAFEAWTETG